MGKGKGKGAKGCAVQGVQGQVQCKGMVPRAGGKRMVTRPAHVACAALAPTTRLLRHMCATHVYYQLLPRAAAAADALLRAHAVMLTPASSRSASNSCCIQLFATHLQGWSCLAKLVCACSACHVGLSFRLHTVNTAKYQAARSRAAGNVLPGTGLIAA